MEKRNKQRRKSRPVSELITIFDHQEAEDRKIEQWRSENSLTTKSPKIADKRKTTTSSRSGNSAEISKSASEAVLSSDVRGRKKDKTIASNDSAKDKAKLALTLNPKSTASSASPVKPKKKAMDSKKKSVIEDEVINLPKALTEEPKQKPGAKEKDANDENTSEPENCNRKKFPLDDSLAVLRREMHSLRKQDVELMSQLLALNSSIQEFKSNSSSSSMSAFSDTSDAETDITEIETQPPTIPRQSWHQRESSGSDTSDFDSRRHQLRPSTSYGKHCNVNRDSLGSEVSGYYSNASPRSSPYGSNRSLNVYDVNASDTFSGSECCSSQPTSPVSGDPPMVHAYHYRQKTWLSQDFLGLKGMTGSDPTLNRNRFPERGGKVQQPVRAKAFNHCDENVKRMNTIQQKKLQTRRNTACGAQCVLRDLSNSGSEHSLSGYDVDSDVSRSSVQSLSNRLQKWQRSRSSCALSNTQQHRSSPPVQNTIKVDLRNNPPTPGTAIELILPLQPLQPTRRSSAVRMAERRPLDKLNTLSKRQSMIW